MRVGSVFYSAALVGGTQNAGALFRVTQAGAENILHSFDIAEGGEPTGLVLLGKHFYGTNYAGGLGYGTVFSATANGQVTILHVFTNGGDGGMPNGALLNVGGVLYGTTATGGGTGCAGKGCGTIYSVTADGTLTTMYTFKGGSDGAAPAGLADRRRWRALRHDIIRRRHRRGHCFQGFDQRRGRGASFVQGRHGRG